MSARLLSAALAVVTVLPLSGSLGCLAATDEPSPVTVSPSEELSAGGATSSAGFVHPGIVVNAQRIAWVKARITEDPWASQLAKAKASSYGRLGYKATPLATMHCGGTSDPVDVGCSASRNDALAAYTHALIFAYTGDEAYAEGAAAILDAWSDPKTGLQTILSESSDPTTSNGPLQAAWLAELFPRSAEILRYTYPAWKNAARFGALLKGVVQPLIENGWIWGNSNWELSMADGLINIGVYNDDRATFDQGVALWRRRVPLNMYLTSDGPAPVPASVYATSAGGWKSGELASVWNGQKEFGQERDNGVTQETCRDLSHTQMGLASTVNAAETSLIQGGPDLYGEEQERIIASHELVASLLNAHPGKTATKVSSPSYLCGGHITDGDRPTWEIVLRQYVYRQNGSMPETEKTAARIRTDGLPYTNLQMAWETLTDAYSVLP